MESKRVGMDGQTWSMSKIKLLESCPLAFYLQYIEKYRFVDENQDTLARDLGLAIHYTFEVMQNGMTIAESYEETKKEHLHIVGEENWHFIDAMMPKVRKFNRMLHDMDEINPFAYVEAEAKMAVDKNFEPVDFFSSNAYFRGVVDYTAGRQNESTIIDFKKGGAGYLTKYHAPQLSSYLLLDYYCNNKFEEGNTFIYYVEKGDLSPGPSISGDMIESHTRPWLVNKIDTAVNQVYDDGYFKFKRGNMCKYCDYAPKCKSGRRGTAGTLTKYEIESQGIL